ncbi:unnamed protein product [Vitrella brassicaformis CCMP3155]|uniref:TOG domain-containing protein n=2 Tax=Vitrella brassicaformis TaxID=1169539 RepID=A0A0G4ECU5_VITBC|nr:unnamed protein product [Vitrella brassicaformis CCMP3155]|eukprot:CEL93146.1 unnamed protein product [Vitrella brassicaformis CCMP3155]
MCEPERCPEEEDAFECRYLSWEELEWEGGESPRAVLQEALNGLRSDDWKQHFTSLQRIQALAKFHPSLLADDIEDIASAVIKQAESLRSGVSRNAILTTEHLGKGLPAEMAKVAVTLVPPLAQKSVSNKRFLADGAKDALSALTTEEAAGESVVMALGSVASDALDRKDSGVATQAAHFLEKALTSVRYSASDVTVRAILPTAARLLDASRPAAKQTAQRIVSGLYDASKAGALGGLLESVTDGRLKRNLQTCIDAIAKKKRDDGKAGGSTQGRGGIREFIRAQQKAKTVSDPAVIVVAGKDRAQNGMAAQSTDVSGNPSGNPSPRCD